MTTTPPEPSHPDQPSWGSAPPTPPTSSGTDDPIPTPTSTPTPTPTTANTGQPGARFFDAIRRLHIVRPDEGRWAAGVAAGLARRWNIHPTAVRIGFVLLTLLGGLGITLYGLGWLLLPHPDGRIHAQQVLTGTVTAGFIGAVLTVLAGGPFFGGPFVHGPLLVLALIGFIVWRVTRHRRHLHGQHPYQGNHPYQAC
jgi:phage shock protein PspC (stress-responsive transcriptional regulator)